MTIEPYLSLGCIRSPIASCCRFEQRLLGLVSSFAKFVIGFSELFIVTLIELIVITVVFALVELEQFAA